MEVPKIVLHAAADRVLFLGHGLVQLVDARSYLVHARDVLWVFFIDLLARLLLSRGLNGALTLTDSDKLVHRCSELACKLIDL